MCTNVYAEIDLKWIEIVGMSKRAFIGSVKIAHIDSGLYQGQYNGEQCPAADRHQARAMGCLDGAYVNVCLRLW